MKNLIINMATGEINADYGRPFLHKGETYFSVNGKVVKASGHLLQVNALLQKDEWIKFDAATKRVMQKRLAGVNDLRRKGLVYNAGNLGTSIVEWDSSSDMTPAEINMAGTVSTEKDKIAYTPAGVPIPIIRKDWEINLRRLLASRNQGASVDVITAEQAAIKVAERSEEVLFNGVSITVSGFTIYGYTNHPQRNTGALDNDWAADATTGKEILQDVRAMKAALEADRHYGPYTLYVNGEYWTKLSEDYSDAKGDNTIYDRLLAEKGIEAVAVSDVLGADQVVLVQLESGVIDLAVAQDVTNVQWDSGDGMMANFATLAAWAPRIKTDFDNRLGIAHFTYTSA